MLQLKMKLIFCVALFLSLSNLNVDASAIDMAKKLETFNENQHKMEFVDLDEDCFYLILGYLDLDDLLSVAQTNVKWSALAAVVYRHKYSNTKIWIADYPEFPRELKELFNETETIDADSFERIEREYSRVSNKRPYINRTYRSFSTSDFETMWILFKHFGLDIKILQVTTASTKSPLKNAFIAYLISKYSSESLIDVGLVDDPDRLLEYLTKPLINVKNLAFWNTCGYANIEIFQKVETLFPQVNKFSAKGFRLRSGSVRLESVTTFSAGYNVLLANYHFPNLQTLHSKYEKNDLAFFNEHRHLRHIHFHGGMPVDSQFEELTANLKDLVEVTFESQRPLSSYAIEKFLKSHEKVKLFKIKSSRNQGLQRLLRLDGWNVTIFDNHGLSFERI